MNIAKSDFKPGLEIGKIVEFEHDSGDYYDGKVTTIIGSAVCVEFYRLGEIESVVRGFNEIRLVDQTVNDWWSSIVDPLSERVLGDKEDCEPDPLKIDAIGRGKKGFGHGSIDWKPVKRKRKSGRVWESKQAWYQWEDERGKHCRYLRKGVDLAVQRLLDEGATVEQILDSIGKSKSNSKGKTR